MIIYSLIKLLKPKSHIGNFFFLPFLGNGYSSEIFLTNYVQNSISSKSNFIALDYLLFIFDREIKKWQLIDIVSLGENHYTTISSSNYKLIKGSLIVIVPSKKNKKFKIKSFYPSLPRPEEKKIDFSPVQTRCRLRITKNYSTSSYQSDYPYNMTLMKTGSAFAFCHLLRPNIYNKIIFINISANYSRSSKVKLFDIHKKKVILSKLIKPNSACIIDIPKLASYKNLSFFSETLAGIPIFLSHGGINQNMMLSLEHSHPPQQYFLSNAILYGKKLKSNWFALLEKSV